MNENETSPKRYLSIVYVSSATEQFGKDELAALLETSRTNNRLANVTGMLLHHDGCFIQAIEGPPDAVRALHTRITMDPRHTGITNLLEREIDEREFGEWQMAFRDLAAADEQQRAGYSDLFNRAANQSADFADRPARAQRLLLSFRETARI